MKTISGRRRNLSVKMDLAHVPVKCVMWNGEKKEKVLEIHYVLDSKSDSSENIN